MTLSIRSAIAQLSIPQIMSLTSAVTGDRVGRPSNKEAAINRCVAAFEKRSDVTLEEAMVAAGLAESEESVREPQDIDPTVHDDLTAAEFDAAVDEAEAMVEERAGEPVPDVSAEEIAAFEDAVAEFRAAYAEQTPTPSVTLATWERFLPALAASRPAPIAAVPDRPYSVQPRGVDGYAAVLRSTGVVIGLGATPQEAADEAEEKMAADHAALTLRWTPDYRGRLTTLALACFDAAWRDGLLSSMERDDMASILHGTAPAPAKPIRPAKVRSPSAPRTPRKAPATSAPQETFRGVPLYRAGTTARLVLDLLLAPNGLTQAELITAINLPEGKGYSLTFDVRKGASRYGLQIVRTIDPDGKPRYRLVEPTAAAA